jgi:hypothetical protein
MHRLSRLALLLTLAFVVAACDSTPQPPTPVLQGSFRGNATVSRAFLGIPIGGQPTDQFDAVVTLNLTVNDQVTGTGRLEGRQEGTTTTSITTQTALSAASYQPQQRRVIVSFGTPVFTFDGTVSADGFQITGTLRSAETPDQQASLVLQRQ